MADETEHLFGKIAITHKFMTPQQVNECLDIQARMRTYGLGMKKVGEIALEREFLTEQQLTLILNIQRAVVEEKRKKEEAARPKPAPARPKTAPARPRPATSPPRPRVRAKVTPPPTLKPPAHRIVSVPTAKSKIDEYTAQVRMGRITSIVGLGIAAIIVVIVLANVGGKEPEDNNLSHSPPAVNNDDLAASVAAEQELTRQRREREAEQLYQEIKAWAAKNPGNTEEITRRCNRLVMDYAETPAATKARLLADFYAELPEVPAAAATDQQKATRASQLYMQLSMRALKLRAKEQWARAIEVYEQFPDSFKDTAFYPKVRNEIKKLRRQIAEKYAADLRTINRLVAAEKYDEARKYLAKIENYASHDLVIAVQRELDAYIAEASRAPGPTPAAKTGGALLSEKLRVAESMFWLNMYSEALKAYRELSEHGNFTVEHPEVSGRIKDLERCVSVLDAVAKSVAKSRGRKRTIYLENRGSVFAEVVDVNGHVITLHERGRGNFEIPLTDLKTSFVLTYAKKYLPSGSVETDLALAVFVLSRGLVKDAEKHIYDAARKNASNDEVARLLERLVEKPPPTIDESLARAKKGEPEGEPDAAKLFARAEGMYKQGKYAQALSRYKQLLKKFSGSDLVAEKKSEIDANIAACEEKLSSPLARTFSGKVIERDDLGKRVVEISYDFEDDKQLADWKEYNWYSIFDMHDSNWHITNGELQGNGSRGFIWKGEIAGDVIVEFDAYSSSGDRQNIQATICDNGEGWNYLFALGLTELGNPKDIIRRNEKFSFGKEIAKRPSDAKSFKTYHVKIVKKGSELSLYVDDKLVLRAKHSLYKKGHVGLFAIGSTVRFDNITITGRLDSQWLKKHGR